MTGQPKVFCIGWAKTGTTSLGRAFETLGYTHTAGNFDVVPDLISGDYTSVFEIADRFEAFDDWPWILLYEEMAARYPDAKFVLTLRDEAGMIRSYRKMLAQEWRRHSNIREVRRYIYGFDAELGTDEQFIERIRQHNAAVRAHFKDQPHRLLEMDLAKGEGWTELCGFLGKPKPSQPFPRANAYEDRGRLQTFKRKILVAIRFKLYRLVGKR